MRIHWNEQQIVQHTLKPYKKWSSNLIILSKFLNNSYVVILISLIFRNVSFNYPLEEDAPAKMAFSYVVHKNPGLFEILLHLTFRPYNSDCIYIDLKASEDIKKAYQSLVDCYQSHFPNTTIFVFPQPAEVLLLLLLWGAADLRDWMPVSDFGSSFEFILTQSTFDLTRGPPA